MKNKIKKTAIFILLSIITIWICSYLCWLMFQQKEPSDTISFLNTLLWVLHIGGMVLASTSPAWILGLVVLIGKKIFC